MTQNPKRFYKQVGVEPTNSGFAIALDQRRLNTPTKSALILPTQALADWVAKEWSDQSDRIDPSTMVATRMANSAIDKLALHEMVVREELVDYGCSDLLCYRASHPAPLRARQAQVWDPLLVWANKQFDLQFNVTNGVMPIDQPKGHRTKLSGTIADFNHFELTAFHTLVTLSGSFVLALALVKNHLSNEQAWNASQIDEIWQAEQWGSDHDAMQSATKKRTELEHSKRFFDLSRD